MERFEVVKKLGRGSYGSAVAAMRKDTKELVVIKRVDMTEMDEAEKKQVRVPGRSPSSYCRNCRRAMPPAYGWPQAAPAIPAPVSARRVCGGCRAPL